MAFDLILPFFPEILQALILNDAVTDLCINGSSAIFVERGGILDSIQHFPEEMRWFSTRDLLDIAGVPFTCPDAHPTRLDALAKHKAEVILLQTAPGLGPRTAEVVAAYLNDASRFKTGKQVSAYGGLVPRQHQSGEMDRRGRITKRGPALLRKLLVECAWCMLRYNAWARGIYVRLTGGG